jgi:hypothetical protein
MGAVSIVVAGAPVAAPVGMCIWYTALAAGGYAGVKGGKAASSRVEQAWDQYEGDAKGTK